MEHKKSKIRSYHLAPIFKYLLVTLAALFAYNYAYSKGAVILLGDEFYVIPTKQSSNQSPPAGPNPPDPDPAPPVNNEPTTARSNGDWHSLATWSNGVPNSRKRAIIPQGLTVTINSDDAAAHGVVTQGRLRVAENADTHHSLTTDWLHVNSGGVFEIGTKNDPYDQGTFTLNLTGVDPELDWSIETANGEMDITNNNGFVMAAGGGRLQFYGKNKLSYTRLSATAPAGTNRIYVRNIIERNYDGVFSTASDGELNWSVGDQIVVASSSYDYADQEVRTIVALRDLGNTNTEITLDAPLANRHYGQKENYGSGGVSRQIDMRAEVAILNRNVKIQGLASQDTDLAFGDRARFNAGQSQGVGGHIMVMDTAGPVNIDSVQLDKMGQSGRLGRYPMHWHLGGNRDGDSLRRVSITNSNNRGVTIHGTHNLLIQDVVLHDIHGHGFFMEDAVETGNTFISNITFGIHKVGGDTPEEIADPFLVDTHDHAGQNPRRFLSSAGYWMTNPDNTWVGNVSAGSEGTGFWFLFPSRAVGLSANDAQYNGVEPNKINLGQFDYNSSHSSPIGLNFDRGSDIERPIGATLKARFDGDEHRPSAEPQINYYTAYKHTTGIYHRARTGNFFENRFADNFTSTFITFTQKITNALYVGHSKGNSDPNQIVTGHSFYDGANTLVGSHFAGFNADNSHMFRAAPVAIRHTHFVLSNTTFENDGTAGKLSYANQSGLLRPYNAVGKLMPSVIYDSDGSLTGHVGGRAGSTVIPDHPFFYDSNDVLPSGWRNARVSDDLYAVFRLQATQNPVFRLISPDGDQAQGNTGTGQFAGTNTLLKMDAGEYQVELPNGNGSASNGFEILYFMVNGPRTGSTVVKFNNMAGRFRVSNRPAVANLNSLRNATRTSWVNSNGSIYVKFFSSDREWQRVNFAPVAP